MKKIALPKFKYKELIANLQAKLKSGKLTEKQKIKVFFFIKGEEVRNMTVKDLQRSQRKYSRVLESIDRTITFLAVQREKTRFSRRQNRLKDRVLLERFARKQCIQLLAKIEKELEK